MLSCFWSGIPTPKLASSCALVIRWGSLLNLIGRERSRRQIYDLCPYSRQRDKYCSYSFKWVLLKDMLQYYIFSRANLDNKQIVLHKHTKDLLTPLSFRYSDLGISFLHIMLSSSFVYSLLHDQRLFTHHHWVWAEIERGGRVEKTQVWHPH